MRVSVFGIGYVGAVVAGCMARQGHRVVAVDIAKAKVEAINNGRSVVTEPGLPEIIAEAVASGRLGATDGSDLALHKTDLSFVCVGTPSLPNGRLDMSHVVGVCEQIGAVLGEKHRKGCPRHTVVMRSTMVPGTMDDIVVPILERTSGLEAGRHFGLGYMPEFLREGQGVADFEHPTLVVIGASDPGTSDLLGSLNKPNGGKVFECDFRTAESVKFAANAWHAAKVTFANEIGAIAKSHGVDGRKVMEILCADSKLNVSSAYLRPGFAFGGSCLPKDMRALVQHARAAGVEAGLLEAVLPSNERHVGRALDMVTGFGHRRVALLGLTFKPDTDDLRHSPLVELAERLVGKGHELRVFDRSFSYDSLVGRNREFINRALPHLASLLVDSLDAAVQHGDTIVIGHRTEALDELPHLLSPEQSIVDLVGAPAALRALPNYAGICW